MKKWLRRLFWIVPVLLVAAGVIVSMRPKPVAVETTTVTSGPLEVTVSGEGKTRVKDRYTVMAPVHGNLARIELQPGDPVDEGDVLAGIEPIAPPLLDPSQRKELAARAQASEAAARQASAAVARAKAALRFATGDLDRIRTLAKQGTLSRAELDTAELAAETAKKDLESAEFGARVARHERDVAKAALERSNVTGGTRPSRKADAGEPGTVEHLQLHSPVDGRVLQILRKSEGVVNPGEPLLELADLNALEIVLDVLTTEAVQITPGDRATLRRWGGEEPLHGRVRMVEPAAFTKVSALGVEEQRVNVVIDIEEPPSDRPRLGDGFALDVDVTVWETPSTLVLPLSALFRDAEGWSCYVVVGDRARLRRVEVGRRNDFVVEIASGLEDGEVVVLHPGDRVRDDTLVAPGA